jgi:hypothetical protein
MKSTLDTTKQTCMMRKSEKAQKHSIGVIRTGTEGSGNDLIALTRGEEIFEQAHLVALCRAEQCLSAIFEWKSTVCWLRRDVILYISKYKSKYSFHDALSRSLCFVIVELILSVASIFLILRSDFEV